MSSDSKLCPTASLLEGKVIVGGVKVARVTRDELAARMTQKNELPQLVFSANGQGVAMVHRDAAFRSAMDQADIIHADGMGVVFASRLFTSAPLPERVATTDFFHDAAKAAVQAGRTFYFLGGTEEENRAAAEAVEKLYPGLIVGRHDGYGDEAAMIADILAKKPDVVWVNLGRPRQEEFCVRYREALAGVSWLKTCGGLFKFLAGADSRAPLWLQKAGFEWLYRMLREPRRLAGRYLWTNALAVWLALTKSRALH